jgi:ABC-2 type transport system ATP-binding protein
VIEVRELSKSYGGRTAVDRLSFQVRPGSVTGFLGPNGAGKSTTIRMFVGLDAPTAGAALIGGQEYRSLRAPLRNVGVLLDARTIHGGRSAFHHLLWLAHSNGIPRRRVEEVLELVGLSEVARNRAGGFSLGMAQRLGIGAALLGDPEVLILDEPVNGLDTEGIRWIRALLRRLAGEGRTVLLSSHLMSETEQTADRLIVIARGRLLADSTMRDFIERHSAEVTLVRSPEAAALRGAVEAAGGRVRAADADGRWRVEGLAAAAIGEIAAERRLPLHELTALYPSLEDVYTQLTDAETEYRGASGGTAPGTPGAHTVEVAST